MDSKFQHPHTSVGDRLTAERVRFSLSTLFFSFGDERETGEMAKPTEAELNEWFKVIDVDGSGKVDSTELREVVKAFYDWQKKTVDDAAIDADVTVRRSFCFSLLSQIQLRSGIITITIISYTSCRVFFS